jgi:hypothetical protein
MLTIRLASILGKLGISTRGTNCISHNSREPKTMTLYLNVLFYIKFYWYILTIPQAVEFSNFSPSEMTVHFISCRKDKIRATRNNSGWLVTLAYTGFVVWRGCVLELLTDDDHVDRVRPRLCLYFWMVEVKGLRSVASRSSSVAWTRY